MASKCTQGIDNRRTLVYISSMKATGTDLTPKNAGTAPAEVAQMTLTAKYAGTCPHCGGHISEGEQIQWERGKKATHSQCPEQAEPTGPATASAPAVAVETASDTWGTSGGEGYGYQGWSEGELVVDYYEGNHYHQGQGRIGVVVSTGSQYYRDDGMSFGVGDEDGHVYHATLRPATDAEAQAVVDEAHAEALRIVAAHNRESLIQDAMLRWERPEGEQAVEGERLMDTQTIYGGGEWWVITDTHVWYVRNNGADGDNWSNNNVRTGGAGAIGRCTERTDALVAQLRALAA